MWHIQGEDVCYSQEYIVIRVEVSAHDRFRFLVRGNLACGPVRPNTFTAPCMQVPSLAVARQGSGLHYIITSIIVIIYPCNPSTSSDLFNGTWYIYNYIVFVTIIYMKHNIRFFLHLSSRNYIVIVNTVHKWACYLTILQH